MLNQVSRDPILLFQRISRLFATHDFISYPSPTLGKSSSSASQVHLTIHLGLNTEVIMPAVDGMSRASKKDAFA